MPTGKVIAIKELRDAVLLLDENGSIQEIRGELVDFGSDVEQKVIAEKYATTGFKGNSIRELEI